MVTSFAGTYYTRNYTIRKKYILAQTCHKTLLTLNYFILKYS